jgi:hypothetical protein
MYILSDFSFLLGKYICLKLPGLCWFFHETRWFSETLEIWWTNRFFESDFFQLPKPNSCLILKIFKCPELMVAMGQEYNDKVFPIYTPSTIYLVLLP